MTKMQKARIAAGMSQSQLAKAAGINFRQCQKLDNGERSINRAMAITVVRIAAALVCRVEDLLEDEEEDL